MKNRLDHRLCVASIFVNFQKDRLLRLPLSTVNINRHLGGIFLISLKQIENYEHKGFRYLLF